MLEPKALDELLRKMSSFVPESATRLQQDIEKNLKGGVQGLLEKMDLVTREEFDVQTAILERTRQRLDALEKRIAVLEKRVLDDQE